MHIAVRCFILRAQLYTPFGTEVTITKATFASCYTVAMSVKLNVFPMTRAG